MVSSQFGLLSSNNVLSLIRIEHFFSKLFAKGTKYVHIKSSTVYAPRRNWDSPQPPTRRLVCSLPPVSGGRGTLAGEKGVGRVPIPTRGIHCGTLYMYVLCGKGYQKKHNCALNVKKVHKSSPALAVSLTVFIKLRILSFLYVF
jgi:hypothetical protein